MRHHSQETAPSLYVQAAKDAFRKLDPRVLVRNPVMFVVAVGCLCSLNFASMNYALVYALDNVGMALSVVIMVIQVAGSGGSYPVHVLPQLFQTMYPFMPFHYGMDMIRETVGGMYGDTYL